jgi:hypothetical protein
MTVFKIPPLLPHPNHNVCTTIISNEDKESTDKKPDSISSRSSRMSENKDLTDCLSNRSETSEVTFPNVYESHVVGFSSLTTPGLIRGFLSADSLSSLEIMVVHTLWFGCGSKGGSFKRNIPFFEAVHDFCPLSANEIRGGKISFFPPSFFAWLLMENLSTNSGTFLCTTFLLCSALSHLTDIFDFTDELEHAVI